MKTIVLPTVRGIARAAAAALLLGVASAALAHHVTASKSAVAVAGDGPVALEGRLAILDFIRGTGRERIYALVSGDGTATRIAFGQNAGALSQGMQLAVTGHASRGALIVDTQRAIAKRSIAAAPLVVTVEGTLRLLHADYFDGGESRFIWTLEQDNGDRRELDFAIPPNELESGMRVSVMGQSGTTGIAPDSISVLAAAPARDVAPATDATAATASNVLVILLAFQPTPPNTGIYTPFWGQANVQATMFTSATSVANYWSEASFGKQTLAGTVTPWLTASFQTPSTCDYQGIATEARRLATANGYNLANYQKFVYVFTRVAACGWAGLGEVPGTQTWSNEYNTLSVIGHEIGHTFGLGHANSLPCNGVTIATNCPLARPEYGDPWDIMGNQSSRHVNAWQKNDVGWVPDAGVATHNTGTATYTLSPLETPGGALYAVQVPAAMHRTYWIEYRTATGFDAGMPAAATNGAIIHLGGLMHMGDRSEYGCWDTCFLDMVPSTAAMDDGGLAVGKAFTDQMTGVTINALSIGAGGLTVSVATPPTRLNFGLYRKTVPGTTTPFYKFLLDDGFDHKPDGVIPYGGPGDIPLVGSFTTDGMTSLVVYRNGLWYIDTNRDGAADRTVGFGGVPGDIPLIGNFYGPAFTDDLVIYRGGVWYVDHFLNGTVDKIFGFGGVAGDVPLVGDINGDGIADLVIYRHGLWYIDTNRDGTPDMLVGFGGAPQDIPLLFDWDGDGKADLCIYRDGVWYISTKRDGQAQAVFGYGTSGDLPFPGKFY